MVNLFLVNDWKIEKFVKAILFFNLLLTIFFSVDISKIDPVLNIVHQTVVAIYLIFIPGFIILRIMKIHNINYIETIIFSIGLSISFLMFFGFFMNYLIPLLGISKPLTELNLIIGLNIVILILIFFAYEIDKNFINSTSNCDITSYYNKNQILFPILIILLSILGSQSLNFYNNNTLIAITFIIISIVPLIVIYDRLDEKLYPLIIFSISISLLYHRSLISTYITGWDSQYEFFYANLVKTNSFWDMNIASNVNSILSTSIFAPLFSNISGIDLKWIFKIVYPFIYSFVPVCLYRIFQVQFNNKMAFLSTYLIMSTLIYYQVMIDLPRQQLSELFVVIIILLMIKNDINGPTKNVLSLIFLISIIVSHYGLTYIFMILLVSTWILNKKDGRTNLARFISTKRILIYISFASTWYIYIGDSSVFNKIVSVGDSVVSGIYTDFLSRGSSQAINIANQSLLPMHEITKYLYIFVQFCIIIGLISLTTNMFQLRREYILFSYSSVTLLIMGIILPYFANQLNFNRIYQVMLFSLSPFFIIGYIKIFDILHINNVSKYIAIFLGIFILFNSGFVYELAKEPSSMSINGDMDYPRFNTQEFTSANWLVKIDQKSMLVNTNVINIYSDDYRSLLLASFGKTSYKMNDSFSNQKDMFFFLGRENIKNGKIILTNYTIQTLPMTETKNIEDTKIYPLLKIANVVYDNGDSEIFH